MNRKKTSKLNLPVTTWIGFSPNIKNISKMNITQIEKLLNLKIHSIRNFWLSVVRNNKKRKGWTEGRKGGSWREGEKRKKESETV